MLKSGANNNAIRDGGNTDGNYLRILLISDCTYSGAVVTNEGNKCYCVNQPADDAYTGNDGDVSSRCLFEAIDSN